MLLRDFSFIRTTLQTAVGLFGSGVLPPPGFYVSNSICAQGAMLVLDKGDRVLQEYLQSIYSVFMEILTGYIWGN